MKTCLSDPARSSRRGTLLPLVLVVIMLLTLGGYAFTEQMMIELESTVMYAREVQARSLADSGIELTLEMLSQRELLGEENLYHNPAVFQQTLLASAIPRGNGRFSVVAPVESNPSMTLPRFGLMNESGKINVNELINLELEPEEIRNVLTGGPEELIMTVDQADTLLDFIDDEDPAEAREFGGETEFNKNAPLESLDELLSLETVTRGLLYGEDANQNGILDPSEDANGDGQLQPGWVAYLTVHSLESNLRSDGTKKINVNQSLLTELYDAIAEEFDEEKATFVVAYRMNGPVEPDPSDDLSGPAGGSETPEQFLQGLASAIAKTSAMGGGKQGEVTRGGLELSGGGPNKLKSIFDLVGSQVVADVDGSPTTLDSPWSTNSADMLDYLPTLVDSFSISDSTTIPGRVNLNEARYPVLAGLPGMTTELADYIVSNQMIDSNGQPRADQITRRSTTGWLIMDGQIELSAMRSLDQFVTSRGDVFRAQVVGHFDAGGPVVRLEAVIDATRQPPKLLEVRDLTDLGRGFSHAQLIRQ